MKHQMSDEEFLDFICLEEERVDEYEDDYEYEENGDDDEFYM